MRTLGFVCVLAITSCGDDIGPSPDLASTVDMSIKLDMLGTPGGPQMCTGAFMADTHCAAMGDMGATMSPTDPASCKPDGGVAPPPSYGDTMCGTMGNDDDCKYTVSWTSTPIFANTDVFFTVTVGPNSPGNIVTGANVQPEVFMVSNADLGTTIPGDVSKSATMEMAGGVYKIGPVQFTKSGQWQIRFHIFEDCLDILDDSQHGHAAFFINVP